MRAAELASLAQPQSDVADTSCMRHVITDLRTIQSYLEGRSKRRYTPMEVEAAERDAKRGDKAALATLDDIEHPSIDLEALMHDCPECRADRERGVQPIRFTREQIEAELAKMLGNRRAARPKWWNTDKRSKRR